MIKTPRSIAQLTAAISGDEPRAKEASSFVLKDLIVSGGIRQEESFVVVEKLAASIDPRIRHNAIAALTMFELTDPVRELLEEALADKSPEVSNAARVARESLRDAKMKELFGVVPDE
jgi:hypothetical protein